MKTQLQTLVVSLAAAIDQLPVDPLRVFVLDMPRPDGMTNYSSPVADIHNWGQAWQSVFPDAVYDNGINRLTWIGNEKPQSVPATRFYHENDEAQSQEMVVEWQDQGAHDPMIEAASTITRLQETEVVLRDELSRQANQIVELEQRIAATNAAIDAAQGQ